MIESKVFIALNRDFIAHNGEANNLFCQIRRSDQVSGQFDTNLEVFYTVNGTGANEVDIVSGSVIIPIGEQTAVIQINAINPPVSGADREVTLTISANSNYEILHGAITFQVKDETPTKAFPTAYGGGTYASGGRGGNVYHVTNLLDDGSVGSFRWALNQPRPATIVFDVSGTMQITNFITVGGSDLTIAGQTAPLGGFDIVNPTGGNVYFRLGTFGTSFENHIWRYFRIRGQFDPNSNVLLGLMPGYTQETDYGRDLIFDHLSFNYGADEGLGIRGNNTKNITFQHGLIAECDRGALFGDTDGNNSGITQPRSRNNTFRNNVFYNSSHRLPNIGSNPCDVYNNVVYDWINRLSVVVWGGKVNHFNNYYYKGNRTNLGYSWNGQPTEFLWQVNGITTTSNIPVEIYSKGNVVQDLYVYDNNNPDIANAFSDDRYIWMHHAGQLVDGTDITADRQQKNKADSSYFKNNPFPYIGSIPDTFLTAEQSKTIVPNEVGAYKYIKNDGTVGVFRDATDERVINSILNDIPRSFSIGFHSISTEQPFIDYQATISTTPINTRPVDFYQSNPHIPEAYLIARGITGDANIHNQIQPSGYTLLEEYINQVDGEVAPPPPVINVTGVNLIPQTLTLTVGQTSLITADVLPSNATDKSGVWTSNNVNVATVNSAGLVTAIGEGSTLISFTTTDGSFIDTTQLTVNVVPVGEATANYLLKKVKFLTITQ